jgi:hypothetical protein
MKHDIAYSKPVSDIQAASDAIRKEGGMMVTHWPDGTTTYGTTQGTVIHGRTATSLIRQKFVVPDGGDLFDNEKHGQLYQAIIR